MLNHILDWARGDARPAALDDGTLRRAVAALLMEAARVDDSLDEPERERIQTLLAWRFGLGPFEAAQLGTDAERASEGAVSWHALTHTIREHCDEPARIRIVEMLWDVILADGNVDALEANLMRRVAALLFVSDADSGAARRRVLARNGATAAANGEPE
jgi:uncharacterized tellurite resistance protein B-like protein